MHTLKLHNPDKFLNLAEATSVSHDDVSNAWERTYAELALELNSKSDEYTLYLVCGIQGAGKTTWVKTNAERFGPSAVFLDGPLHSRQSRKRMFEIAQAAGCQVIAVWIKTPIELALERNSKRSGLARIKETTIRRAQEQLEPPTISEGFIQVIEVTPASAEV